MLKIMKDNLEDMLKGNFWQSLACETIGTLLIVLFGCGMWLGSEPIDSMALHQSAVGLPVIQVSFIFGLSVATMMWIFSHISGGHFNPAVTVASLITRRVSIIRGLLYIVAQMLGGVLGAAVLYGLTPKDERGFLGATYIVKPGMTSTQGFGVELVITFIFIMTYFALQDCKSDYRVASHPFIIGCSVVVGHLFGIQYTKAGMNCARSFGPAVIMGVWEDHWVYWVGPLTGGISGVLLYDFLFSDSASLNKAKKCFFSAKKSFSPTPVANGSQLPVNEEQKHEVIEISEKEVDLCDVKGNAIEEINSSDKDKLTEGEAVEKR